MTVQELIDELKKYPSHHHVFVDRDGPIVSVDSGGP